MQPPEKEAGPGDGAPRPRCIAQQASAVQQYAQTELYGKPNRPESDRTPPIEAERSEGREKGAVGTFRGKRQTYCWTVAYRDSDGRKWRYSGKRARVLDMLVASPDGITQWDCLPWHTRLGASIHVMREDGLAISTELEGEYRHARYRLATKLTADDTPGEHRTGRLKSNQRLANGGAHVG